MELVRSIFRERAYEFRAPDDELVRVPVRRWGHVFRALLKNRPLNHTWHTVYQTLRGHPSKHYSTVQALRVRVQVRVLDLEGALVYRLDAALGRGRGRFVLKLVLYLDGAEVL